METVAEGRIHTNIRCLMAIDYWRLCTSFHVYILYCISHLCLYCHKNYSCKFYRHYFEICYVGSVDGVQQALVSALVPHNHFLFPNWDVQIKLVGCITGTDQGCSWLL